MLYDVGDELYGVYYVEGDLDIPFAAADHLRTRQCTEDPDRQSAYREHREIEEGDRAGIERFYCGADAEDEEYVEYAGSHHIA